MRRVNEAQAGSLCHQDIESVMDFMNNKASIETFCSYFQDKIKEIKGLNHSLFQKILIVIYMDALSRVYCQNKINKNKDRFICLIEKCVQWEHAKRVSIPMTYYRIVNEDNFNEDLKNNIINLFGKISYGRIHRLDIDPFISEIDSLIETDQERRLIDNTQHSQLLYTYRNNLVHEFRMPGNGMEFSNDNESPYYHGMINLKTGKDTWELVYPTQFFINFAQEAINKIKDFLLIHDLDPYTFFEFGSPWN